ncbi:uncharacterized protein LOC133532999 isoform X2 [Cydia pomonella]|nr:uncharacterized protein LOC133532999 isoform X2 [Cydia pomonella]
MTMKTQEIRLRPNYFKRDTIGFTCIANGNFGDILSWYQIKGSTHILLRKYQHMRAIGILRLNLNMTLQQRDHGTRVYCTKDTWPAWENSTRQESELVLIPFKFKPYTPPLETPIVTVMPNTNPYIFEVDDKMTTTFICNGTKPVDGRKLTWYILEPNSKPKYLENQILDSKSFTSILSLQLNKTYHRKKLFCAQDFEFKYTHPNGTFYIEGYGELARSETIILLHREILNTNEEAEDTSMDDYPQKEENAGFFWLIVSAVAAILILAAIILFVIKYYKSRARALRLREDVGIPTATVHMETREEDIGQRPPYPPPVCPPPPELVYDEVYAHGAGLKRRPLPPLPACTATTDARETN